MTRLGKNKAGASAAIFIGIIMTLIVALVIVGFIGFNNLFGLLNENSALKSNLNSLQSNYTQLQSQYNQLKSQDQQTTPTPTLTPLQEGLVVQSAYVSSNTLYVIPEQTAGPAATVKVLIIKDATGNTVESVVSELVMSPPSSSTTSLLLTIGTLCTLSGQVTGLISGSVYTVTVATSAGGTSVSPSFTAP